VTGQDMTWGGAAGAAAGGFVTGAIVGAFTGDVSAAAVVGIGTLAGGAGAATNSVIRQGTDSLIQTGSVSISLGQVGKDTLYGAVGGAGGAAAGRLISQFAPKIGGAFIDDFIAPPPALAFAGAGGRVVAGTASREAARAISTTVSQHILAGSAAAGSQMVCMKASGNRPQQYNAGKTQGKAPGATRTLTQAEQRAISRIDNAIRDHLKPHDYTGTLRDMVGNPVPKRAGGYFNHVKEMNDTLRGLRNNAEALKNATDPAAQAARQRALDAIKRVEDFTRGAGL